MILRSKRNGRQYLITTEEDEKRFCIYARSIGDARNDNFVMHYRTLEEFCEEWADIDEE